MQLRLARGRPQATRRRIATPATCRGGGGGLVRARATSPGSRSAQAPSRIDRLDRQRAVEPAAPAWRRAMRWPTGSQALRAAVDGD